MYIERWVESVNGERNQPATMTVEMTRILAATIQGLGVKDRMFQRA